MHGARLTPELAKMLHTNVGSGSEVVRGKINCSKTNSYGTWWRNTANCLLPAVNMIQEHSCQLPAVNTIQEHSCLPLAVNMIQEHSQLSTASC